MSGVERLLSSEARIVDRLNPELHPQTGPVDWDIDCRWRTLRVGAIAVPPHRICSRRPGVRIAVDWHAAIQWLHSPSVQLGGEFSFADGSSFFCDAFDEFFHPRIANLTTFRSGCGATLRSATDGDNGGCTGWRFGDSDANPRAHVNQPCLHLTTAFTTDCIHN